MDCVELPSNAYSLLLLVIAEGSFADSEVVCGICYVPCPLRELLW